MSNKKTVIVGSSASTDRFAYQAAVLLRKAGHDFIPIGIKKGHVLGNSILDIREKPVIADVDTITLYIRSERQNEWEDYLIDLKPKRIIFNPGAENRELLEKAQAKGIECEEACTLVMIRTGQY